MRDRDRHTETESSNEECRCLGLICTKLSHTYSTQFWSDIYITNFSRTSNSKTVFPFTFQRPNLIRPLTDSTLIHTMCCIYALHLTVLPFRGNNRHIIANNQSLELSRELFSKSGNQWLFGSTGGIKTHRVQELCESRGGRPGLSVLTSLLVSVDVKLY